MPVVPATSMNIYIVIFCTYSETPKITIKQLIKKLLKDIIFSIIIMSRNALCMWDFVFDLSGEILSHTSVLAQLKGFVKKLTFQLEEGNSGYRHFQA